MKTKYLIKKILRKIYHFIGFISLFIIFLTPVYADTCSGQTNIMPFEVPIPNTNNYYNSTVDMYSALYNNYLCINTSTNTIGSTCTREQALSQLMTDYNNNYSATYPYYVISLFYMANNSLRFDITAFKTNPPPVVPFVNLNTYNINYAYYLNTGNYEFISINLQNVQNPNPQISHSTSSSYNTLYGFSNYGHYAYYDSNFDVTSSCSFEFSDFYNSGSNLIVNSEEKWPKIKDLVEFSSWSDYENNYLENYSTVNLDDYEYVLLTLKDYSQSTSFQTNLQVKGQIGITPIYNYGQTSKDQITGVKVQDRCNLSYSNYTSMPLFILQSDLQNNVIYAVKSCSSGSSFKFDNTIFDITYVTQSNLDNPTVTIYGKTYNVIPYADLPSTATQNETENYIPGAVGDGNGPGGLAGAIQNGQKQMAEIWNVFTYFTDYVNQIFNALPPTLGNLLISAFACALVLGLIKIFIH